MIPLVKYNKRTFVYAGDLIPTVAHIPLIWNMSYDIESLKTIEEKRQILNEALEINWILIFQHDANVECCTLGMTAKGIRAAKTFTFKEITDQLEYRIANHLRTPEKRFSAEPERSYIFV
jgi:hypothetical protein